MLLVPALEDENLMTQGKDFCLQCNSRPERIAEADEQENQDRKHRQEAYRCSALSAISTARIEFLVGTRQNCNCQILKEPRALIKINRPLRNKFNINQLQTSNFIKFQYALESG
jgi:hypothetical protein